MNRFTTLATIVATGCMALATPAVAQTEQDDARYQQAQDRFARELSLYQQEFDRYQQARRSGYRGGGYDDRRGGGSYYQDPRDDAYYDPARDYRAGANYQERVLSSDDRVYRGTDGRYYCKRNDGTTGLILGAGAGGVLGNVIDGGHSRVVGTLLGAAIGAVAGKAIDQGSSQNQVRCR